MEITFESIVGKTIIVGITYIDKEENIIKTSQYVGKIIEADENQGIVIEEKNSKEILAIPPQLSAIEIAKPGEYKLKSTGEIVVDPDLLSTWICDYDVV